MATLGELVDNLGGMVVELIAAPQGLDIDLGRVVVHDPLEHIEVGIGDVVLAVGIGTANECSRLVRSIAAQGAAALILKGDPAVVSPDDAEAGGVAILMVPAGTPWAQVVLLISSVLASDRFRDGDERLGNSSAGDLFAVANAIADTLGAPITIEDPQSIVLAFSGRQDEADPARVATVLGRRVPEMYRRLLTDKGIFKRLYAEHGPVYCEQLGPEVLPRVAIAVRAGDEVLGSIWAAVQGPLDPERERMLIDAAGFVSLHLLRHQVAADAQRGLEADLMAAVLNGGSLAGEASRRLDLTGPGYRVLAVGVGDTERADRAIQLARCRNLLALQLSAVHRGSPTAQVGGVVYAIVPSLAAAGTSAAPLRQLMEQFVARAASLVKVTVLVGVGPLVRSVAEIPASRGTADKVLRVLRAEPGVSIAEMDDVRASALLMEFASAYADDPALTGGPVELLRTYDAEHNTNYTETLSAYLDAFGDVDAAARILNVHANTVRYRLRQLHKLADLRLDDPSQRLALMLQLRLASAGRT
jgi:hypothetical protein